MNNPIESNGSIECYAGGSLRVSHEICGAVIIEADKYYLAGNLTTDEALERVARGQASK